MLAKLSQVYRDDDRQGGFHLPLILFYVSGGHGAKARIAE
jgi:hypothetical protein